MTGTSSRCFVRGLAAAAALLALNGTATAQTAGARLTIGVFADHYVMGAPYDDLNLLESKVKTLRPAAITLDACGPGVTRALLAAAHRFHHLPLELRVLDAGAPECSAKVAGTVRVGSPAGPRPLGIDDEAVAAYARGLMP
ncbi:MAG TPA: hypothetical protein VFR86_07630 [Burkholderiaceae bacterium]|nr:hypothetical protein [Burkholderiaceae bacterium]